MNPAERILRTLACHLEGPAQVRLLGGAALILGYGLHRSTEDVDLLHDTAEMQLMIEEANIGAALEATNHELEPEGLYLTHIWGPEQQILTPRWRSQCRSIERDWGTPRLRVSVLGPIDLILSKLCRADDADLDDIRHLIEVEGIERTDVVEALAIACVPDVFEDIFADSGARALTLFDETG